MKRVYVIFFGLGLVFLVFLNGCQKIDRTEQRITQIKEDVGILAADSLEGREVGTEGEKMAADYIKNRYREIGLLPKGDDGTYFQDFSHKSKKNPHETEPAEDEDIEEIHGRNVIGYIDNQAELTVVIGAHYDHLGWGDEGSLNNEEKAIHNGADDNASGVASLLLLAEELQGKNTNNNYLFIAFSGEEKGLWGSNYFTKNATIPLEEINYMLSDLSVINGPKSKGIKTVADFRIELKINTRFIERFLISKASIPMQDTPLVTFIRKDDNTYRAIFGQTNNNSNYTTISVNVVESAPIDRPISFNSDFLKDIFSVNKSVDDIIFKISNKGLGHIIVSDDIYDANYYIVESEIGM